VVIDPIQSVKGKVVIDAFRCIPSQNLLSQREARQTTSNIGHLHKPSIVALIHGLNRHYYSIAMSYRTNQPEQAALKCIERGVGLPAGRSDLNTLPPLDPALMRQKNLEHSDEMVKLSEMYAKSIREELDLTKEQLEKRHVGKRDPKRHLKDKSEELASLNILQNISTTIATSCF
jgi:26S proteasome regulatory subunit N11